MRKISNIAVARKEYTKLLKTGLGIRFNLKPYMTLTPAEEDRYFGTVTVTEYQEYANNDADEIEKALAYVNTTKNGRIGIDGGYAFRLYHIMYTPLAKSVSFFEAVQPEIQRLYTAVDSLNKVISL